MDPACVMLYEKVKLIATEAIQSIKAEVNSHISKGKWG